MSKQKLYTVVLDYKGETTSLKFQGGWPTHRASTIARVRNDFEVPHPFARFLRMSGRDRPFHRPRCGPEHRRAGKGVLQGSRRRSGASSVDGFPEMLLYS